MEPCCVAFHKFLSTHLGSKWLPFPCVHACTLGICQCLYHIVPTFVAPQELALWAVVAVVLVKQTVALTAHPTSSSFPKRGCNGFAFATQLLEQFLYCTHNLVRVCNSDSTVSRLQRNIFLIFHFRKSCVKYYLRKRQ